MSATIPVIRGYSHRASCCCAVGMIEGVSDPLLPTSGGVFVLIAGTEPVRGVSGTCYDKGADKIFICLEVDHFIKRLNLV